MEDIALRKRKPRKDGKKTYYEENGSTRAGDTLRWMAEAGKEIAPAILTIAGNYTGVKELKDLANVIRGDGSIDSSDKEVLLKKIELDIAEAEEITLRWEADMRSEHWLPKLIRPLVVANFTILIDIVVLSSMWGRPLGETYLPLIMTMGITAIGGYFSVREYGKTQKLKHS